MKKRFTLLTVISVTTLTATTLFSQKLTSVPVASDSYSSVKTSYSLRNQLAVREAFAKEKKVFLLDFAGSEQKSLPVAQQQQAAQMVDNAEFVSYSDKAVIAQLLSAQPAILSVQLPFRGELLTADLVKADLFGDNFKISASDNSPEKISTGIYYQGMLRGQNSMVSFSFFEGEFSALIIRDAASENVIEAGVMKSENGTPGTHIVYADEDLRVEFAKPCETEALAQYHEALDQLKNEKVQVSQEKALLKCVTYYWETSYNMFQYFGTTTGVSNYMTSLFNNFQLVFNNESIGSKLNEVYIWTTADSYNNSLDDFSANRSGFNANLAVLFSRTGGGGVAWLNSICMSGEYYRHAFCGSVAGSSTIPAFPNYSWPLNVTTHEVGHNLGSPHTHACTWTGGAIDGCGPTAGYSEGCTGPTPPSGGGTIMSYCHLTSTGINIANGFGTQPGNLVRSRVNSCITLTCETSGGGTGTDPCVSAFEPNESMTAATLINAGTSYSAAISTSTDVDFFRISTSGTNGIVYNLNGPSGVDFDLTIYNSAGTQVGTSTSGTATETVSLTNQAAGTYYIRVFGYNGANSQSCYTISATVTPTGGSCSTAFEPNESLTAAATISYGATNSAAITSSTDKDYFKVVTTATANNTYRLVGPSGVDYDLVIYNSAGTQIGSGTSSTATENVTINSQAAGTYYAYVYGYNGANSTSCYTIRVAASGTSVSGESEFAAAEERISVYPNPTNDKLFLGGTYSGDLINSLGQTVMHFEKATQLSMADLRAGIYILKVDGITEIQRIVKE